MKRATLDNQSKLFTSAQLWQRRLIWLLMGIGLGISLTVMYQNEFRIDKYHQATQRLRSAGVEIIEIREGMWGACIYDPRMKSQQGRCFDSISDAVQAAIAGERPGKLGVVENIK